MARRFGSDKNVKQMPTICDQLQTLIRQERIAVSQDSVLRQFAAVTRKRFDTVNTESLHKFVKILTIVQYTTEMCAEGGGV